MVVLKVVFWMLIGIVIWYVLTMTISIGVSTGMKMFYKNMKGDENENSSEQME